MSIIRGVLEIVWNAKKHASLHPVFGPGDANNGWWNRLALNLARLPNHGLLKERFGFQSASCILLDEAVRKRFIQWVSLYAEAEELQEASLRKSLHPAHVSEVTDWLWSAIEGSRNNWNEELLAGLREVKPFNGVMAQMPKLDVAMARVLHNIKDDEWAKMLARLILLSARREDISRFVESIAPAESFYDEKELLKEKAEREKALRRAKEIGPELKALQPESRYDEDGRDTWVGCYFAMRYFNARASAPVDHLGRALTKESDVSALDALGLETGASGRNLYRPTARPAWEGGPRPNVASMNMPQPSA